jgi:TonB family protein
MTALLKNRELALINYGAEELKAFAGRAAMKGFVSTMTILLVIIMMFSFLSQTNTVVKEFEVFTVPTIITSIDIKVELPDIVQKTNSSIMGVENPLSGTKKIAGDYVAVNDNIATVNISDIALFENSGTSSSTLGEANTIAETLPISKEPVLAVNDIPATVVDDHEFIFVEKEPVVDMQKLHRSIVYPYLARKAGVQGKVLVSVLISSTGNVLKSRIEDSENQLLNNAAIEAIMTPGLFTPAMQDNRPVKCWITIPISFKLK